MSEENVEIVRKAIEAGNRRDLVMERALHAFTQADSDVVVPNIAHMRGRDGIEVIARSTFVYTVKNGQITRFRMFQERAEAFEAAGPWE